MSTPPKPPNPGVDTQFWFDLSKEMVKDATSGRNEAAAKAQTALAWLWGIYTASATIGVALAKASYPLYVLLLIASPSVVLIAAYWFAVWVQMPVDVRFDPRLPRQIREEYTRALRAKGWKLRTTLALSLIAAVMVTSAIVAASLSKQTPAPNLSVYYHESQGVRTLAFSGQFPGDTKLVMRVTSLAEPLDPTMRAEFVYVTPSSGELRSSVSIPFAAAKYRLVAEWEDETGVSHTLGRVVATSP